MSHDAWDPNQYDRFKFARQAPFFDLLALLAPVPGGRVLDLGCGSGALTRRLHEHTMAADTLGLDTSASMLAQAQAHASARLQFRIGDLAGVNEVASYDLIAANASLHWVPDHPRVLTAWTRALRPGGQLAVQVPANPDHPSHTTIDEVLREEPFFSAFAGAPPADPLHHNLTPERYAELLDSLGYREQHVRLQVYGHHLRDSAEVVEWVKGTALTRVRGPLEKRDPALYERFVQRYRERLLQHLGERAPFFYPFKRILFWARLPRG